MWKGHKRNILQHFSIIEYSLWSKDINRDKKIQKAILETIISPEDHFHEKFLGYEVAYHLMLTTHGTFSSDNQITGTKTNVAKQQIYILRNIFRTLSTHDFELENKQNILLKFWINIEQL